LTSHRHSFVTGEAKQSLHSVYGDYPGAASALLVCFLYRPATPPSKIIHEVISR